MDEDDDTEMKVHDFPLQLLINFSSVAVYKRLINMITAQTDRFGLISVFIKQQVKNYH